VKGESSLGADSGRARAAAALAEVAVPVAGSRASGRMLHPGGSNALHPFTEYSGWEKCVSWRKPAPSVPMEKSWQVPEGLVPRGSAETMIFARRRPSGSPGAPSRRWRRSACTRAAAARRCYGTPLRHLLAGRRATGQRSPRGPVLDDETDNSPGARFRHRSCGVPARIRYEDAMPRIPWLDVGVLPVLQMLLLPPLVFRLATMRRRVRR
jgi:hypothetical protein